MKNFLILLLVVSSSYIVFASRPDPRMENFKNYIKTEKEVQNNHPYLLFSAEDIPLMRKKMNDPYFKNYVADLIYFADNCLKKFPDDYKFPFTENPNYQTVSEALVMAYVLTGDKKYSKKAIALTTKFVYDHYLKVPVRDSGKFEGQLKNGNSISFILNTIAIVYDSLYNEMKPRQRFRIRKGLAYFCKITYEMAVKEEYGMGFHKNYRAGGMGALGLACLAIKDEVNLEVHEWLDKATRVSIAWCNVAIKPDGVYPEGVTYFYYMIRNQLLFFEALERDNGINYFKRTNLKNALTWTLWSSLPWKYEFDNFGDGTYTPSVHDMPFIFQKEFPGYGDFFIRKAYGDNLRYRSNPWAILYGKAPMKIVDSANTAKPGFFATIFGMGKKEENDTFNPLKKLGLAKVFPVGGVAGFRSGWGDDDMLLLAYATDYEYASHSQSDRGQFNIYAYGKKWAVSPGYGNDAKIVNSSTPSQAHNLVLIDGKGEAYDPSMRQSGTFADIVDFKANDHLGYVKIDQKDAYDWYIRYHYVNKREWNPVKRAFRNILFINKGETPPYVLIYDDIQKDNAKHEYSWQFHTTPGNVMKIVKDGVKIDPSGYAGKIMQADGSGSWNNFISPGFAIFKEKPGLLVFKVNVPKAGKYILWAYGKGTPGTGGETEVLVNGKSYARFAIGKMRDFCWLKFSDNRHRMHKTILLDLKEGDNEIKFKGVTYGYELVKCLLTENTTFIPTTATSAESHGIVFGTNNLIDKKDVVIAYTDTTSTATCSVKMLHPSNIELVTDYYQPSKDPQHQRALFKSKTVAPNFLTMVYPRKEKMEIPKILSNSKNDLINTTILWSEYNDYILINLNKREIKYKSIKTDAKILFCRFDKNNNLIRLMVTDGKILQIDNEKIIDLSKTKTTIIDNFKKK